MAGRALLLLICVGGLAGCLVQRRERIQAPAAAPILRSATLDELIAQVRARQDAIQTLQATVQIEPSVRSELRAEIVHYRDVRAFLLIRKPGFLRMIGQYPVVRSTAFDLASDGDRFGLHIPSKNRFLVGNSDGGKRSASGLENLRPQHILDALLVAAPGPGEESVRELATEGLKSYFVVQILRRAESGQLLLVRKLWFERVGLTLERLQMFDEQGELATDARYARYEETNGVSYPREIAVDRPLDHYGLILTVEELQFNQPLPDDKFQLRQPPGTELVDMEKTSSFQEASRG
jgi:hypothetical protein